MKLPNQLPPSDGIGTILVFGLGGLLLITLIAALTTIATAL